MSDHTPRFQPRIWSSARLRLTFSITFAAMLAFISVVFIAYQLLWFGSERNANAKVADETAEFVAFAREGSLSATGQASPNVTSLLRTYLGTRYPDDNVLYVATSADGRTQFTLSKSPAEEDDTYPAHVRERLQEIGSTAQESSGLFDPGGIRWGKVTIDGDSGPASLLVAFDATSDHQDNFRVALYLLLASGIGLLLTAIFAWLVSGRTLDPVRKIREAAQDITADDLSQRVPEGGADEFDAMAKTFNAMLERLEAAYRIQREFLDDAGHELRTPLTVVQGNLDLMSDDPEERAATIRIVQDELTRMTRIVEELLTLARSSRPDFLRLEPTDIAELVLDIESKIEVTADRDWMVLPDLDAEAMLDRQRITQALLQFCANAVRFTKDGDPISIGCRLLRAGSTERGAAEDGERILFWVQDSGAGIPPGQERAIFERFQTARGQLRDRRGGTGLGLAIVSTIAESHGGSAFAFNNDDGPGASFCMSIPFTPTGREIHDDYDDLDEDASGDADHPS